MKQYLFESLRDKHDWEQANATKNTLNPDYMGGSSLPSKIGIRKTSQELHGQFFTTEKSRINIGSGEDAIAF